jgi:hypothetical protein
MELDLQSLVGPHVNRCYIGLIPRTPPPPHLGSYTRTLLVSQDRRHLFVTPWLADRRLGWRVKSIHWKTPTLSMMSSYLPPTALSPVICIDRLYTVQYMPLKEKKDQERGTEGAMIVWGEGEEPNKTTAKRRRPLFQIIPQHLPYSLTSNSLLHLPDLVPASLNLPQRHSASLTITNLLLYSASSFLPVERQDSEKTMQNVVICLRSPLHTVYVYTVYVFTREEGKGGELNQREGGVRGATVHKAGSKIPTWLTESPVY